MGIHTGDLNHIREANGVDMNSDPLSKTLLVFSINSHLFLIGVVTIGEIYLCSCSAENVGNST
jgi:hypothetical protein